MSGNQILISFFADEKSLAEQELILAQATLETAATEEEKKAAQLTLSRAQAFLDVATQIQTLFDASRLSEKKLKEALQSLRGVNLG